MAFHPFGTKISLILVICCSFSLSFFGNVQTAQSQDMGATVLVTPTSSVCATANQTVTVKIKNYAAATIDFSVNPCPVIVTITGPLAQSFTVTLTTGTLATLATQNVPVTTIANLSTAGSYTVDANTEVTGDVTPANNAMAAATVTVNSLPTISAGGNVIICSGSNAMLYASGGISYAWAPGGQTTVSILVSPTAASSYTVTGKDANGCTNTAAVNVNLNFAPVLNLGPDIAQCGGTVTLNAGNAGSSYNWSTGATTQTIAVSSTGTYWAAVSNLCGNNVDTIHVTIHQLPTVNLGANLTQCGGTVTLNAGNAGSTYAWSNGATTSAITVSSSGTYFVATTDAYGCHAYDTVMINTKGQSPPLVEGFESLFPPSGWTLNNPDNDITWAPTVNAAKKGLKSLFMDNYSYPAIGQVDEIITPGIDLSGGSAPAVLTFQVAYQLYTNPNSTPNYSDTLLVQVSTDCGVTWTTPYLKYGASGPNKLTTATPTFSTVPFIPSLTQWRLETVTLPMASKVEIRFLNISGYGNQLYIDDININNGVGVNDINLDNYVSVFPNPSAGIVFVNVNTPGFGHVNMKLYNVVGEVISETTDNISVPKKFTFDISNQPSGIYLIEIKSENGQSVKKIILNK